MQQIDNEIEYSGHPTSVGVIDGNGDRSGIDRFLAGLGYSDRAAGIELPVSTGIRASRAEKMDKLVDRIKGALERQRLKLESLKYGTIYVTYWGDAHLNQPTEEYLKGVEARLWNWFRYPIRPEYENK